MIYGESKGVLEARLAAKKYKKIVNCTILSLLVLSFMYALYWVVAMSDDIVLGYTEQYFKPLAQFLNPNDNSLYMYRNTSLILFLACLPISLAYGIIDSFEAKLIKHFKDKEIKEENLKKKKEKEQWEKRFDSINQYSICLSIDYESKRVLTKEAKETLTKIAYKKITSLLKENFKDIAVVNKKALIILSSNFEEYDKVYSTLLTILADIKKKYENTYALNFVPTMTTEAFNLEDANKKIEENHFEIQSCNFKNRACTTTNFVNKYRHLKHEKYAGIPIGDYVVFDNNKSKTFKLNIVYKNLRDSLAKI